MMAILPFNPTQFYQRGCALLGVTSTSEHNLQELFNTAIQSSPSRQAVYEQLKREFPGAHSIIPSEAEEVFTFTTNEGCEFYLPHSRLDVIKKNSYFMEGLIGFTQHSGANCKLEMDAEEFEPILRMCLASRERLPQLRQEEVDKLRSDQMHGKKFDTLVFIKMIETTDFFDLDFQSLRKEFDERELSTKDAILSGNLDNVKLLFAEELKATTFRGARLADLDLSRTNFLNYLDFNKFDQTLIFQIIIVISLDRVIDCLGIIKALNSSSLSSEEREVASSLINLMPPHIRLIESFDFSYMDEDMRQLIKKTFKEGDLSTKAAILSKLVSFESLTSIFQEELKLIDVPYDYCPTFAPAKLNNEMLYNIFKVFSINQKYLLIYLFPSYVDSTHATIDLRFSLMNLMTFDNEMLKYYLHPFLLSEGRFYDLRCLSNFRSLSIRFQKREYEECDLRFLDSLLQLRELCIFDLTRRSSVCLNKLTNLRSLTIEGERTKICFLPHALEELVVTSADIDLLSEVGKCTNLRKLSLKDVRTHDDLKPLSKLTKLQSLDLDLEMKFPDPDPLRSFVGLTELKHFTFKDFTLTDLQWLRLGRGVPTHPNYP